MTPAHGIYVAGLALLVITVVTKRNVVALAIGATFVTALAYTGSVTTGLLSVFNASLTAATELFTIFLIIALVTAMLRTMSAVGADKLMMVPFQRMMRNGGTAYVVVAVVSYVLSTVFWPTPAIALIAVMLVPAAVKVGLSPFGCALAVAITGQGMALASDFVMGVAPSLSAQGAGVPAGSIADRALIVSLVAGVVALVIAYLRDVRGKNSEETVAEVTAGALQLREVPDEERQVAVVGGGAAIPASGGTASGSTGSAAALATGGPGTPDTATPLPAGTDPFAPAPDPQRPRRAVWVAVLVPLAFAALLVYVLLGRFTSLVPDVDDGVAAPLIGGLAALMLVALSVVADRRNWLETTCDHFVEGITSSVRSMGMVIPVAGFVYIGLSDYSGRILGLPEDAKAPGFLLDVVAGVQPYIPEGTFFAAFAMLVIGMVIGLDGSGWPGLPFTGSLSAALAGSSDADPATLAAIAQTAAGFTGGGTLLIWSSVIVVAGITGVPVIDLTRRLFLPVVSGLVVATAFAAVVL